MNCIQMLIKVVCFCSFLTFGLISCNDSQTKEEVKKQTTTSKSTKQKTSSSATTAMTHCFQNENPHEGTGKKDIVELQMNVKDGFANGVYNWLPAEKDQRKGRLRGKMEGNIFKGEYSFTQEGKSETTQIEIILARDQAIVKAEKAELGLNERIKKVECGE